MKTTLRFIQAGFVILAVMAFYACEKSPDKTLGTAEFSVALPGDDGQPKSGNLSDSVSTAYQLLISVEDMDGSPVLTDKLIPLYAFGSSFLSEKVEIRTGELRLVKFMVINASGTVLYAAPVAGSPMAYLTSRPLPIKFVVAEGEVTQVTPEVLVVGDSTPDKFGYASFGVSVIKPLTFWAGAVIDNPMIMAPSPFFTEAKLTVRASDDLHTNTWHYSFRLFAGVNKIIVRGGSRYYTFLLEKEGFLPQKFQFTAEQLLATSQESPLYLKIPWDAIVYQKFVLQPGPEEGKDAMVSNLEPDKNFGGHKYFEATFLSEPVLTVMRLNRSLIAFTMPQTFAAIKIHKVNLRLSYEVPIPWDSIIFTGANSSSFIGGVLQQVVEPWEENTVTWNKQPKTIEANQVFIPPIIRNANFIEVDVTSLFVPKAEIAAPNHGMLFRLLPEDRWPGFRFASSDHPNVALRPMLTVYYTNL